MAKLTNTTTTPDFQEFDNSCGHTEFEAAVQVQIHITDGKRQTTCSTSVKCKQCGMPFVYENGAEAATLQIFPRGSR